MADIHKEMRFSVPILTLFLVSLVLQMQAQYRLTLPLDETMFRHRDLKEFSVDTLEWDQRKNYYTTVDSASFFQLFQDSSSKYYGFHENEIDKDFYYSIHRSVRGLIELSILWQREGAYCDGILYMIYDSKGTLVSSFRVAGRCADGGFYETASGRFLNDSTYCLLSEDNYATGDVDRDNLITFSKDITVIKRDGRITSTTTTLGTEIRPHR